MKEEGVFECFFFSGFFASKKELSSFSPLSPFFFSALPVLSLSLSHQSSSRSLKDGAL